MGSRVPFAAVAVEWIPVSPVLDVPAQARFAEAVSNLEHGAMVAALSSTA